MKIYISGKITGLEYDEAFAAFTEAADWIRCNGHQAVNPMDIVKEQEGKSWIEYICEDLAILNDCEAIFLLHNWQDSKGARLEKAFMEILGRPVLYQETPLPMIVDELTPIEVAATL